MLPRQRADATVGKPVGVCQDVVGRFFGLNCRNLRPDTVAAAVTSLAHMLDNSFVQYWESEEPALLKTEENIDEPDEFADTCAINCRYTAALALGGIGPAAARSGERRVRKGSQCASRVAL